MLILNLGMENAQYYNELEGGLQRHGEEGVDMRKILTVVGLAVFLLSAQMAFGDGFGDGLIIVNVLSHYVPEETVEISQTPVIPLIKTKPFDRSSTAAGIADFSYTLPPGGEITSASIEFPWSGKNLNKISKLHLYLDDVLVLDFGDYLSGLSKAEKKALKKTLKSKGTIPFSLLFTGEELEALEEALADGEVSLTLVGKPRLFRSLQLGEVSLKITEPLALTGGGEAPDPTFNPNDLGGIGVDGNGDGDGIVPVGANAPEPATLLLIGSGLIGLAGYGRKKFKR